MILFHNGSTIKDDSNQKKFNFFKCSEQYRFSYEGKAYKIKFRFGVCALQDTPLCSSAVFGTVVYKVLRCSFL
jgi:hypothetical protein